MTRRGVLGAEPARVAGDAAEATPPVFDEAHADTIAEDIATAASTRRRLRMKVSE
ncbi:MAG: hypothetical protein ACO1Q7_15280 [Gemmatimonas sp.]